VKNRSAVFYRDLNNVPPTILRGEGVYIEDDVGRRYLGASANAGVVAIGHGRTEIARALADAGTSVTFVYNATFTHPWQEELAGPALTGGVFLLTQVARIYRYERARKRPFLCRESGGIATNRESYGQGLLIA
jgi:hypothetical protein